MQNVLAKHEMFENFGGGETSKQGQAVETISCQANNVGQFRQAFRINKVWNPSKTASVIIGNPEIFKYPIQCRPWGCGYFLE